MATRRSHTKSRNGCRDCKRRKVKCDEVYPSCFNCTRHGITCSLSLTSQSSPSDITPQRPSAPSSAPSLSPASKYGFLDVAASRSSHPAPNIEVWNRSLELMHHYTLATADSLATRPDMQYVWRVVVPEIGYNCNFVSHGILALAALHKAYLIPSERETYVDLAAAHQTAGLEGFRAELHNINDTNWQSFFSFSSLVVLFVSSIPLRTARETETLPHVLELFSFIRGIRAVIEPYQARLIQTKFSPLVYGAWVINPHEANYHNPPMHQSPLPKDIFKAFGELSEFFHQSLEGKSLEEYLSAIAELEKAIYLVAHAGPFPEVGSLIFWPYTIPENIMNDIQSRNPYSILLVSYFAVPLCVMEQRFWYMKGWSRRLLGVLDECLTEYPALMEMAEWPRKQITELYGIV
ncbi:uncharacterized protein CTRU02_210058 [Colletotrichum truncatum]|uniref:Uncharacterized protein n=1 Tax=Colletotrichum truncatum TaxID=5467 RepID=A0ACC3YUC1_COLTU